MTKIESIIHACDGWENRYCVVRINGNRVERLFAWATYGQAIGHYHQHEDRGATLAIVYNREILRNN